MNIYCESRAKLQSINSKQVETPYYKESGSINLENIYESRWWCLMNPLKMQNYVLTANSPKRLNEFM